MTAMRITEVLRKSLMPKCNITNNAYRYISGIKFTLTELQSTEIPNGMQLKNEQRDLLCQVRFMTKLFSSRNLNTN